MKPLRDRSLAKQGLLIVWKQNCIHRTWVCLLPMLLIACSGSLGKIQLENINDIITQSEIAIERARLANAQDLALDTLQQAENSLASAKAAVAVKDGFGAMHLAYNALTQAQIAEQEAIYESQGHGLNAIIKQKKVKIAALQADLKIADGALEKSRTDNQQLNLQKNQLQADMNQKLQETEQARRSILNNYNKAKTEHVDLQSKLDTIQTQFLQAQERAEERKRQIRQLRHALANAQSLVEKARKAVTETQTRTAVQAQSYPTHIEQLSQSDVQKQQENRLARKKQEAKAYIQQKHRKQQVRTNSTSLTTKQIARGRTVISDWALAWAAKDIQRHLKTYTQDATLDQTVVRSSNERYTQLNRQQMGAALKRMANSRWQETEAKIGADGKSVIGTYRFSRPSQQAISENLPTLHDVWTREVWARQIGTEWKIFRENWRVYEAVPRYDATLRLGG